MKEVAAQLDQVVANQPIHKADRAQAQAAAEAFLGVLPDDASGKDFYLSVSGSVSWTDGSVITAARLNVSASLAAKA